MLQASHQLPESRWSRVMEFHLLVMSMYRMSTAAMDKLLLLSLQFLPKMGRDTLPLDTSPVLSCHAPVPLPGLIPCPTDPPSPQLNEGVWQGAVGEKGKCK